MYSPSRVFSPDCTLHSTITHVILVLERRTPTHDCAIGIHVSLPFLYCYHASDRRVQCAIGTKNPEMTVSALHDCIFYMQMAMITDRQIRADRV